mmetsp:Transcript_29100/g.52313  ORF Transcript_29100/g.52313 Transcript_29100/m.52313 type:complete len:241 (+) Transcript_29100:764-1486(+)
MIWYTNWASTCWMAPLLFSKMTPPTPSSSIFLKPSLLRFELLKNSFSKMLSQSSTSLVNKVTHNWTSAASASPGLEPPKGAMISRDSAAKFWRIFCNPAMSSICLSSPALAIKASMALRNTSLDIFCRSPRITSRKRFVFSASRGTSILPSSFAMMPINPWISTPMAWTLPWASFTKAFISANTWSPNFLSFAFIASSAVWSANLSTRSKNAGLRMGMLCCTNAGNWFSGTPNIWLIKES